MSEWISNVVQFQQVATTPLTEGSLALDVVTAQQAASTGQIIDFYAQQGINTFAGNTATAYSATTVADAVLGSEATTGAIALETNIIDGTARFSALSATETGAGASISAGGASTMVGIAPILASVAVGTGLGYKAYKDNPSFWTAISESIFGQSNQTFFEVIGRYQDGEFKTFLSLDDYIAVTQALANENAYWENYKEEYHFPSTPTASLRPGGVISSLVSRAARIVNSALASKQKVPVFSESAIASIISTVSNFASDYDYIEVACNNLTAGGSIWATLKRAEDGDLISATNIVRDTSSIEDGIDFTRLNNVYSRTIEYSVYRGLRIGSETIISGGVSETAGYVNGWTIEDERYDFNISTLSYTLEDIEIGNPNLPRPEGTTVPTIAPNATEGAVLGALSAALPELIPNGWERFILDPVTGDIKITPYIPISLPNVDPVQIPSIDNPSFTQIEAHVGTPPVITPNPLFIDLPTVTPNPPTPPTPDIPIIPILPEGLSSNKLFTVYNPSMANLNSLGGYLWSDDILTNLAKFFQNPMDGIISLHTIYASPSTGGSDEIILGVLNSHVTAPIVTNQFININCGTVSVSEYFGDVRDYSPYSKVEIYLPFVGIVPVSAEDIISSKVKILYTVDVYTGAVLAQIEVTKNGSSKVMYTYGGNCAVQVPLTGADRTRLLSGIVAGAMAGGKTGGVVGSLAGGIVGGARSKIGIDKSGGFSSNSGAMGIKKPYILITRTIPYDASAYNTFYGHPSNMTVILSSCKGYTRVKDVHVDNIDRATDNEKNMISNALKSGVIIN